MHTRAIIAHETTVLSHDTIGMPPDHHIIVAPYRHQHIPLRAP